MYDLVGPPRQTPNMSLQHVAADSEPDDETPGLLPVPATSRRRPHASMLRWAALLSVPLLWGTFTPVMKGLLDQRRPPPVILTNLVSHAVGTLALGVLWVVEALPRRSCMPEDFGATASRWRMVAASCELGVYLFFGQLLQLIGLGGTSATSNAILVQASVVIVPIFEARCSPKGTTATAGTAGTWTSRMLPSLLSLAGIATITVAPQLLAKGISTDADESDRGQTSVGVLCSLASACCYALHTLRLSEYGDVDATVQATGQVAANTALDLMALPIAASVGGRGSSSWRWLRYASHGEMLALRKLLVASCWNGIFIVGATTWGMSYAQCGVHAARGAALACPPHAPSAPLPRESHCLATPAAPRSLPCLDGGACVRAGATLRRALCGHVSRRGPLRAAAARWRTRHLGQHRRRHALARRALSAALLLGWSAPAAAAHLSQRAVPPVDRDPEQ